jgi:hypothetical protein
MDKNPDYPILETTEELRKHMEERRHSMARTVGQMRQEMEEALDWETYVRRYPGTVLMAAGTLGWIVGRHLKKKHNLSSPSDSLHGVSSPQSVEGSTRLSRIADQIVSSIFSQALAVLAISLKEVF